MTEVLLLLAAILLSLLCGAFVAAEFSLTTVERAELERAVERGERGAAGALKAVRSLTFQLSGPSSASPSPTWWSACSPSRRSPR